MVTLHDIAPEFSNSVKAEIAASRSKEWDRGNLTRKLAEAEAEVLRLRQELEALQPTEEMKFRQRLFLNMEETLNELLENPKIDPENRVISAEGHRFGCFCGHQDFYMIERRRQIIEFCKKTGFRIVLTTKYNCALFVIDGMLEYEHSVQFEEKWIELGYNNPNTP